MLTHTGSRLVADEIDRTESELGLKLPRAYRDFLARSNGGTTADESVTLFGIDTTPKIAPPTIASAGKDFPPDTLAIASLQIERLPNVDSDDQPRGVLLLAQTKIYFWNDARWTPFFLERNETSKTSLEATFAKAYKDFFAKLEPLAPSFDALCKRIGGELVEPRPPIEEADIIAFETRTKSLVPPAYRTFLLEKNGARSEGGAMLELEKGVSGRVRFFLGIHRKQPQDLRAEHKRIAAQVPKGMLPIGVVKGPRTFLLDVNEDKVFEWTPKTKARPLAQSFDDFLASVLAGKLKASPKKKVTELDFRRFITEELEAHTAALTADLKNQIFKMKLAKGAESLDFEVFVESLDAPFPIVGYQMNAGGQIMPNVAVLPDVKSVIASPSFEPFRGAEIPRHELIQAELVMKWFVRVWRAAGGKKLFRHPASIMVHDHPDDRVVL